MGGDIGTFLMGPFFTGVAHDGGLVRFAWFLALEAGIFPVGGGPGLVSRSPERRSSE